MGAAIAIRNETIEYIVRVKTPNVLNNSHGHWRTVAGIRKAQRAAAMLTTRLHLRRWDGAPLTITLTRLSAGTLDAHDALPASQKSIVDGIADALGLASDSDPRLTWRYGQERCKRGEYGVRVSIERSGP